MEFGRIAPRYSLEQIDQGIWGILGENLRLYELLWEASVPLDHRVRCIRSMFSVFSDFVAQSKVKATETCYSMWWDLILHGFWAQIFVDRSVEMGDVTRLDPESRQLLDVMYETLVQILALPDARSQDAALHGLGHLHHPAVRQTVQAYIDARKSQLTPDRLDWLEQCRDGTVI